MLYALFCNCRLTLGWFNFNYLCGENKSHTSRLKKKKEAYNFIILTLNSLVKWR